MLASAEKRRVILAEHGSSGMSAAWLAKLVGIKYEALSGWMQRHRQAEPKEPTKIVLLLEALMQQTPPLTPLTRHLLAKSG